MNSAFRFDDWETPAVAASVPLTTVPVPTDPAPAQAAINVADKRIVANWGLDY